mgnify:CR=1 FL=1
MQSGWRACGGFDKDVGCVPFDEQDALLKDFALDGEPKSVEFGELCGDRDQVVVLGGAVVGRFCLDDGEHQSIVLQLLVCRSQFSDEFVSRSFEEDEVVGVVNDAHLVGVCVGDSVLHFYGTRAVDFRDDPVDDLFRRHSVGDDCYCIVGWF